MRREEWIDGLRPGDAPVRTAGYGLCSTQSIVGVASVSATGIVTTTKGEKFNPDGRLRGHRDHRAFHGPPRIRPATQKDRDDIAARMLRNELRAMDWNAVPLHRLRAAMDAVSK